MESSRWVVFDVNLAPLEQAVIYANAQEGERIAIDLRVADEALRARRNVGDQNGRVP